MHDTYTAFLPQALPVLIDKFDISKTLAGVLSLIQRIPSFFNFLVGILAENVKARYFVIFAPALTTVSMSLIGIAPGYIVLAVLLFVSGISSTLFHVPAPVMIRKVSGNRVGMGMSYFMLGGELARTIGPLVIVLVVDTFGWGLEGIYRLFPFGIAASVILFFRLKNIEISKSLSKGRVKVNYWKIFVHFLPIFIAVAGITFFRAGMKSALTYYLPTYITEKTGNFVFSGISLSVLQLAGAAGTFYAGTISDIIGRKTTLFMISIASPLLLWLFIVTEGFWTIPVLIIMGFFLVAPTSVILALINELETEQLAFVNGIYLSLSFVLHSIGIVLVGFFSDLFGMELTFKASAILGLFAIVFVLFLPGRVRKRKS